MCFLGSPYEETIVYKSQRGAAVSCFIPFVSRCHFIDTVYVYTNTEEVMTNEVKCTKLSTVALES